MDLKVIVIDDEEPIRKQLVGIFNGSQFGDHKLIVSAADDFDKGLIEIEVNDYDFVILDLFKGKPSEKSEKPGYDILLKIQSMAYIPVIFYSGLTKDLEALKSEIVGVVNKGDGIEALRKEVERIVSSNLGLIKKQVYEHIRVVLRDYFWDTIHNKKELFLHVQDDVSLGYLLLRRVAYSLSKENIKNILNDKRVKEGKTHPMEFYIFPSLNGEYEAGEILERDKEIYIILTPSCDFVEDKANRRDRKVGPVLLAYANPLCCTNEYKKFKTTANKENRGNLQKLIESRTSDRYFFLPGTPFIDNLVIDFQNIMIIPYQHLQEFSRLAKLDEPFAQSMLASFIRHYNRVGFPDIDADFVISKL